MTISKCPSCEHQYICKYKSDYEKVLSDVPLSVSSPFKLILDCEYYRNTTCHMTTGGNDYSNWSNCSASSNTLKPYPAGGPEVVY